MQELLDETAVAIEFPQKGEMITSSEYTIRIAAPLDAQKVEVCIDGNPYRETRQSEGFWWFDWCGIAQGYHQAMVRVTLQDGFVFTLPTHEMEVQLNGEPSRQDRRMSTQVSVLAPNRPGMLAKITQILSREGVDLSGVVTERIGDQTAIRFVTERENGLRRKLVDAGFPVLENKVFNLEMPNRPGEINRLARLLAEEGANIVSLYSTSHESRARCVVSVDRPEAAARALARGGIEVIDQER